VLETTKKSIDNLYAVFKKYRLNSNMEASPLYDAAQVGKWNRQISSKSMQELNGDELAFLAFKVGYT